MDSWQKFNETIPPNKKVFYSELYLQDITEKVMFKVIPYCLQIYLKTLKTCVLKYMKLILLIFCLHPD